MNHMNIYIYIFLYTDMIHDPRRFGTGPRSGFLNLVAYAAPHRGNVLGGVRMAGKVVKPPNPKNLILKSSCHYAEQPGRSRLPT